ncbi:FAS-associated death domain protein-like [Saccostrea echinata]|uniref:FAS-associated death domain protein-like n=1 Tax=Saccostrea echinata TaxID=191078 RepID=UPI002A808775|nr:FAS-associated death domain protein-like [Saccostrea echinata]
MAADFEYKQMLLKLDKSLKTEEFESLMFLCKDDVRKRERENVKRPTDLWEILETREKLGPTNLMFLKDLIRHSCNGRVDVMKIIENFENGIPDDQQFVPPRPVCQPSQQPVMGNRTPYQMNHLNPNTSNTVNVDKYMKEINFLTKNLGKEWRFFMRTLGVTDGDMLSVEQDYPRSLRDQIYQCLVQWISDNGGQFDRGKVIGALRDSAVERYDLAGRIEDHDI